MGEHVAYGCDGLSFLVGKELCLELFSFYLQFGAVWDSGGDEVCGVGVSFLSTSEPSNLAPPRTPHLRNIPSTHPNIPLYHFLPF